MVLPIKSGLVLHLEATSGVTSSGDTVVGWADESGFGNDLGALGDPQFLEGQTPTGAPAIVFDGTEDLLERRDATDPLNGLPTGGGDRTVFFVVDYEDPNGVWAGLAYGDGEPNETFGLTVGGEDGDLTVQGWGAGNDFDSDIEGVAGGFRVQSVVLENDVTRQYQNGTLIDSDAHVFATDPQRLIVGGEIADAGQSQMRVAAALIYDRALSDDERQEVESYLQNEYIGDDAVEPNPDGPLSLEGFSDELVLTRDDLAGGNGFFLPISMAFLPDNRMLLLSKDGEIRIVDPESGQSSVYMILNNIDAGQERGLLDITLDPDFESNGKFYLYYTPDNPENARIASFQHQERSGGLTSRGDLASETVIWEDTDGYLACCHYGGGLDFGPDDKLWLTTSDKFQATTPGEGSSGGVDIMLDLTRSSGKIIRVNKDGSVPDGSDGTPANPYVDGPGGNDDYVWAYGLRNPFRARWDAEYGYMYVAEVGGNQQLIAHDDLHLASLDQPGAFYGWPFYEGTPNTYVNDGQSSEDPADFPQPDNDLADPSNGDFYSAPIWSFAHGDVAENATNLSASLTGGEVYRGNMFPAEWDGVYFYGDYTQDYIRYLRLDETGTVELGDFAFKPSAEIPGNTNEVVSINVGNDGALYYTLISSGEVRRIVYNGDANVAPEIVSAGVTPSEGDLPLLVTFEAEVVDANGDLLTYALNFGDGSAVVTGEIGDDGLITVDHTYAVDGRFDVSLNVSDGSVTALSQVFEVAAGDVNFAPEIDGENSDLAIAEVGSTVTFTATVTDADGDPLNYVWRFGDGNSVSGTVPADGVVTVTHVYAVDGGYNAVLEVDDGTATVFSEDVPVQVGTATEVPVTNGLMLLLQSDIKIGLLEPGSSTVAAWLDGSGNGNNLFARGDPQLLANQTPSGESAIVFDGVGDLLERVDATDTIFNLPAGNADRTIFTVFDYVAPDGVWSGVVYGDGEPNQAFGLTAGGRDGDLTVQGWGGGNDFDSDVEGVEPGWLVQSVRLDDDVMDHYLDGQLIDSQPHVFDTDVQRLVIGGEIADLGQSQLKVAAVLAYDRALSEPERQQVEAFLQNKYLAVDPAPRITTPARPVLAENGTFVLDIQTVDDVDSEDDGLVYSITRGRDRALFDLDPSTGALSFIDAPDFETPADYNGDNVYKVWVTVSDSDANTDVQELWVTVTDVDESGAPNNIPVTTGLVAAYEADQNVSVGADATVTGWLDGSGNGNDLLAQGDPQLSTDRTPSGQSSIVFDGTDDLLERDNATDTLSRLPAGDADRTIVAVLDYVAPDGVWSGVVYGDGEPNQAFGLTAGGRDGDLTVQGWGGGNDFDSDVEGVEPGWLVQSVRLDDNVFEHFLDGTLIDSGTHTFDTDLQRFIIGGEIADLGQSQLEVAAVFVYDRALSDAELQQVETYLQDKYLDAETIA